MQFHNRIKGISVALSLLLVSTLSVAATPTENNYVLGLDVQGQRLNLYNGCAEGNVTCDDMLLVAPDLARMALSDPAARKLNTSPYTVKIYKAKTNHSTCKDGITPCGFQGYSFYDDDILGFIDPMDNKIHIRSQWTDDNKELSYQDNSTYLPLASQTEKVNDLYKASDKALNNGYQTAKSEVRRLYGKDSASELYKEQLEWIKKRSKICGADINHLPRNQAEKVCFIQKNTSRMNDYFLWID